jgi:hypothetical protein
MQKKAKPLHDFTQKDVTFEWTDECQRAFQILKDQLVGADVLTLPDPTIPEFILDTDASNYAIDAVLSQVQNGQEQVIAYGSQCLDNSKCNYCVTRCELLAVVYFMTYFHHYLLGAKTTVRTDHGSLHWIMKLEVYDWKISHQPGKQHGNADAMSRRLCGGDCVQCQKIQKQTRCPMTEEAEDSFVVQCLALQSERLPKRRQVKRRETELQALEECKVKLDPEILLKATQDDPLMQQLKNWKTRPEWEEVSGKDTESKFYWHHYGDWKFDEKGFLWYRWVQPGQIDWWKIVIPTNLRVKVFKAVHDTPTGRHLGEKRCLSTLKRLTIHWVGMAADLRYHCRTCDMCFRCKPGNQRLKSPMSRYFAEEPLQRMAIDIAGPFQPAKDTENKYIMVVMDYFTK